MKQEKQNIMALIKYGSLLITHKENKEQHIGSSSE
jgi:hypothetical protein